jgi:uncharacterized membrane protein
MKKQTPIFLALLIFLTIGALHTVTAGWETAYTKDLTNTQEDNQYSLTVTTAGEGTFSQEPEGSLFDYGTVVTLTAVAESNWSFDGWSGDIITTTNPVTLTMDADKAITATFNLNNYSIAVSASPAEGGTVAGGGQYDHGQMVVITATVNSGYSFINWIEGGTSVSSNAIYIFPTTDDRFLVANFSVDYGLLLTPNNAGSGNPGQTIIYTHTLTNMSPIPDVFDIVVTGGSFDASLISTTPITLTPGASTAISLAVTIPSGTPADTEEVTTLTATSQADGSVTGTVTNTTTVNATYGLLLASDSSGNGNPGQTIIRTHTFSNLGNITDTFNIALDSDSFEATFISPTPITMPVGASTTISLTVAIPAGIPAGTVDITSITATSQTDASLTDTAVNTTTVSAFYAVQLIPNNVENGNPGQSLFYNHTLTNLGNVADTYDLAASSSAGFEVTFFTPTTITLQPGSSANVRVRVKVANQAAAGMIDITSVTATSRGDTSVSSTATNTTTVNAVYALLLTPNNARSGNPGQTLVYTHTLTNLANITDTFSLSVSSSADFDLDLISETPVTLPSGASATLTLTVAIPPDAAGGLVDFSTLTAGSHGNSNVTGVVTNTTTVNPVYALLLVPDNAASGDPGQTVVYTHTLTNLGNGTDTFAITTSSLAGFEVALISPTPVTLTAGASTTVELAVTIPPTTPGGTNDITSVTATSQGNTNVSGTAVNVTTAISPIYNPVLGPDNSGSGFPGQTVVYTHTLTNQGNTPDTFVITANSSAGFGLELAPAAPIPLPVGHSATITLAVTIPPGTPASVVDTTTVTATSQGNISITDTATNTTSVNSVAGVMLTPALSEKEGEPGETVSHSFMVHNSGNAADTFTMSGYSSEGFILAIEPISVTLPHGESAPIIVAVTVPLTAAFGTLDMTVITTTSTIDGAVSATATAHTLVEENIPGEYQISGQVKDQQGNPVAGVTISAGSDYNALTDSNGNYILTGLPTGSYTLTPGKSGYSFTPASLSVTVPPNAGDRDFTAVRLPGLLYLPMVQNNYISYFEGPWEVEPNNSSAQANGPLRSGRDYFGYPNDAYDFFSVYLTQPGQLNVTLTNHTGQGVQLQLFYQSTANRVGFVPSPPYTLSYNGQAGWYYIFIFTESGFNSTTPYTLRVTYP